MPLQPDEIAREFRAAILAADHARAERLASEYSQVVSQVWESLPEAARADSALPGQVRELFTWARGMTIVQRAMLGEHLAVLEKAMRYGRDRDRVPHSTIHVSL